MADIIERSDILWVLIAAPAENDDGHGYRIGFDGVTEMRVVKRHGPMDWIPYIEVYRGEQLHAEMPQHQTLCVEFLPAEDSGVGSVTFAADPTQPRKCPECGVPDWNDCDCVPF